MEDLDMRAMLEQMEHNETEELRRILICDPEQMIAKYRKFEKIIAYTYQICGDHNVPDSILDILAEPEEATDEQVEAMLPYQREEAPTIKEAREALDNMDDYARMSTGVNAIGPRECLEKFIDASEARFNRLRAVFHVNMTRAFPGKTHEEIAAEIDKALL